MRPTMPDGLAPDQSTLRDADALHRAGLISDTEAIAAVGEVYAIAIPPALRALIDRPDGPIGRQFIPHQAELVTAPWERPDPIGDEALSPVKGIVHRYPDRALLKPLLACPVYCRFCFRREQVGPDGGLLSAEELRAAVDWLAARPQIREVILTGGEPLMLSARRLSELMEMLGQIPHLELIRLHTRMPIAAPERIDAAVAAALGSSRVPLWLVAHVNHAEEITAHAAAAFDRLRLAGIPLLSQSVLLRGVNDSVAALDGLFRALLRARVKPYYLHQLDSAPGTARFHVPIEEGRALLRALRGRISGMALPTYVLDIPGGAGKVPLGPDNLLAGAIDGNAGVVDPWGGLHRLAGPTGAG
jgi:lysine 2,3-aminomutase